MMFFLLLNLFYLRFGKMAGYKGKGQNLASEYSWRQRQIFKPWNWGSFSIFSLQINDLIFWSTKHSWALDLMSVGCSATLKIRPVSQCPNADFIYNISIWICGFYRYQLFALLLSLVGNPAVLVLHARGEWLPLPWKSWGQKRQNAVHPHPAARTLEAAGGTRFALAGAERCGSQPARHVNMSLNLGVWDGSGTTCILKLNTCFTRSGQMVLHAQKWHLQGHIGSVWQSQELKPDLPSANPVP